MLLKNLNNKKIMVWGLGTEGRSVIEFLEKKGIGEIVVYNDKPLAKIPEGFEKYRFYDGDELEKLLREVDVVIKSPGVSLYNPLIDEAKKRGVVFTSSTDICFDEILTNRPNCKIIAISGSKGKSTSVSALYHIMQEQGMNVALGGNIGRPLIELINGNYDYIVAEVSSYQAADLTVSPQIVMFTNLFFVHSSWHRSHENYCRDKLHLIAHQKEGDICFVNVRNPELMHYIAEYKDKNIVEYDIPEAFHAEGKELYLGGSKILDIRDLKICGDHNLDNLAGVFSIVKALGMDVAKAAEALKTFEPLAHRLQNVAVKNNVMFINDSISTAPEAAVGAMKSFDENIVIISGGEENVQNYSEYAEYVESHPKVKMAVTLFQCGPKIAETVRKIVKRPDFELVEENSLESAVNKAYRKLKAVGGGIVLFSPTSPSFGFYKNFMERGQHFIDIVSKLDV